MHAPILTTARLRLVPAGVAEMDEPNAASKRVAEKLGMAFIGTRPGPAHPLLRYVLRRG